MKTLKASSQKRWEEFAGESFGACTAHPETGLTMCVFFKTSEKRWVILVDSHIHHHFVMFHDVEGEIILKQPLHNKKWQVIFSDDLLLFSKSCTTKVAVNASDEPFLVFSHISDERHLQLTFPTPFSPTESQATQTTTSKVGDDKLKSSHPMWDHTKHTRSKYTT